MREGLIKTRTRAGPAVAVVTSRRGLRFFPMVALAALAISPGFLVAQGQSGEYHVKAAFLLNFAQFIEWPVEAFADAQSPIVVGVLGDDPFGSTLEEVFREASAQGRPLIIQRSRHVDDLRQAHLIFISRSERDRISEVVAGLKDVSAATVSEIPEFARRGGVINFYLDGKKVRFEINPGAAERKRLKISSQLLKRARIVD